uniref:Nucleotid_trans domain-containing protein n=1 Tax=Caenorhabditis tropicalis TaxID=1561998 RepID=A0A1I7T808_9PELO
MFGNIIMSADLLLTYFSLGEFDLLVVQTDEHPAADYHFSVAEMLFPVSYFENRNEIHRREEAKESNQLRNCFHLLLMLYTTALLLLSSLLLAFCFFQFLLSLF